MDNSSFALLAYIVDAQLERLRSVLAGLAVAQRGSTYVRFVSLHLGAIDGLVAGIRAEFAAAGSEFERFVIGRKAYRLKMFLEDIHGNVVDHKNDIGRRDLPVGVLYLIDALIEDLLKASADPVIHLGQPYMYSTVRMADQWAALSAELGVSWSESVEPVVFSLPGLDPANALLAPILAHEVGHSVIQRHDLIAEVDSKLDESTVDGLKQTYMASPNPDVDDALNQFARWVEELLCDALATELTGPGLLFAGAVFLPASSAGYSGPNHPDPAQRIALTLEQLDRNGWSAYLSGRFPVSMKWMRDIASLGLTAASPRDLFLRQLVDHSRDAIIEVAQDYVGQSRLEWSAFALDADAIDELVRAGIPPAELNGEPVSAWYIIASVWMSAVEKLGDNAEGIAKAADDRSLSQYALKSIEMSRVLHFWRSEDAASA